MIQTYQIKILQLKSLTDTQDNHSGMQWNEIKFYSNLIHYIRVRGILPHGKSELSPDEKSENINNVGALKRFFSGFISYLRV